MFRPGFFGIGKLGLRLTLAFLGVALTSIIVMSGVAGISTGRDVDRLVAQQEDALSDAVGLASGALYGHAGWKNANLQPVFDLIQGEGGAVAVHDMRGNLIQATPGFASFRASHVFQDSVMMRGKPVGSVTVKFDGRGLGSVPSEFRAEEVRATLGAAGIVALLALFVSLLISRQITLPLERVVATVRARGAGDRSVRVGEEQGTGVIHELSVALNESSDAVDKRDRLQKNLVANIAHELRTPVAILQASHEAMLDGVTPPTTENLWSLRDEVLRLARMIDDLQRLAAAEAAALQLTLVPKDLSAIAADSAASLCDSFGAASVGLVSRLNPAWIMCDPDRTREVITNLLTNALKFTPAGGSVEIETSSNGDGSARLMVSDTGIGIPSDELPRVTERFFRGQRSSEMATGSGIGLTIVAELVRAQKGSLCISSEPGKGTQAIVTLPGAGRLDHGRRRWSADQQKPSVNAAGPAAIDGAAAGPDQAASAGDEPVQSQGSAALSS
jgi:two-component system sensor histidine kinase BaeS